MRGEKVGLHLWPNDEKQAVKLEGKHVRGRETGESVPDTLTKVTGGAKLYDERGGGLPRAELSDPRGVKHGVLLQGF